MINQTKRFYKSRLIDRREGVTGELVSTVGGCFLAAPSERSDLLLLPFLHKSRFFTKKCAALSPHYTSIALSSLLSPPLVSSSILLPGIGSLSSFSLLCSEIHFQPLARCCWVRFYLSRFGWEKIVHALEWHTLCSSSSISFLVEVHIFTDIGSA